MAQVYAQHYGVSVEEALKRIKLEQDSMPKGLQAALTQTKPPLFVDVASAHTGI